MKKVLLTNLYFQKYTGSELHTLEIAKEFEKFGYEVTICTFSKTYPLLGECEHFNIIEFPHEKLKEDHYDILFIQHYPIFDYLCTHYSIQYKYIIMSKLSSFNDFESLPKGYEKADLISVVSQECANSISKFTNNYFIFKNSVSSEYFDNYTENKKHDLKNIAVISNHVPNELYQLRNELQKYNINYFGVQNTPVLVTPNLLSSYDLVITIGRTVQQCFACGTPVYVYDHFGGPGYITQENINKAEDFNFSGRGFSKKSVEEIKKDILNNYSNNLTNLKFLYKYAQSNFSLENTFKSMISRVTASQRNSFTLLEPYTDPEKTRIRAYSEFFPLTPYLNSDYHHTSQLYFSNNGELNENDSTSWPIASDYVIKRTLHIKSSSLFRFDPSSNSCKCQIYKVIVDGEDITKECKPANSSLDENQISYFLSSDPQYIIFHPIEKEIYIEYKVSALTNMDLDKIFKTQQNNLTSKQAEIDKLYYQLHPVKRVKRKLNNK